MKHTQNTPEVHFSNNYESHVTGMKTVLKLNTSVDFIACYCLATLAVSEGVCIYCHTSLHQET